MLAIWSLIPLPFLKQAWTSGSSQFAYCWSLTWRILSITNVWDECNCAVVCTFFGIAFFGDWNENLPFPVLWSLLSLPNLLAYWVQYFHSISFRIWYSSTGIPSPSLALFLVMLPKATWLHAPGCLVLGEWSYQCDYLGCENLLCIVLRYILATSS